MAVVVAAGIAYAQATPPPATQHELDVASFVYVWKSIRDTHWQEAPGGLDWQEIREEYEPRVNAAKTGDELQATLRDAIFNAPIHWREMYPTVETVGIESINGEDAYRVLQTPAEGSTVTTYYSVKTGLAIKSTTTLASQMGNIPVEAAMSEYKEFEGVLSPTKMVQNAAGQTINISIDSVQVNVDIPDERFDLPEAVQALVK
jgi:hypothetical protein